MVTRAHMEGKQNDLVCAHSNESCYVILSCDAGILFSNILHSLSAFFIFSLSEGSLTHHEFLCTQWTEFLLVTSQAKTRRSTQKNLRPSCLACLKDSSCAMMSVLLMSSSLKMSLPVETKPKRERKHCGHKRNRKYIQTVGPQKRLDYSTILTWPHDLEACFRKKGKQLSTI